MISAEQARRMVTGLHSPPRDELVSRALRGEPVLPLCGGWDEDQPEDVFIALLGDPENTGGLRADIIRGCKVLLTDLMFLAGGLADAGDAALLGTLERFTRLVNLAGPPELAATVLGLAEAAQRNADVPPAALRAIIQAAMAYGRGERDAGLWERFLERREVAAFAFTVLLRINPRHRRVENALVELWRHRLLDDWTVDAAFLTRHAVAQREGDDGIAREVFHRLCAWDATLRDLVRAELERRDWTQAWLPFTGAERSRSYGSDTSTAFGPQQAPLVSLEERFRMTVMGQLSSPIERDLLRRLGVPQTPQKPLIGKYIEVKDTNANFVRQILLYDTGLHERMKQADIRYLLLKHVATFDQPGDVQPTFLQSAELLWASQPCLTAFGTKSRKCVHLPRKRTWPASSRCSLVETTILMLSTRSFLGA